MAPTLITVTGTFNNPNGTGKTGTATFQLTANLLNSAGGVWATTDPLEVAVTNGAMSTSLYATNDPTTTQEVEYLVTLDLDGTVTQFLTSVPYDAAGGIWDISNAPQPDGTTSVDPYFSERVTNSDIAALNGALGNLLGTARKISRVRGFGHSYGRLGASEPRNLYLHRLANQLGVGGISEHVSGSNLLKNSAGQGGWATIVQNAPPPVRSYGAQQYAQQPGLDILMSGINDINDYYDQATFLTAMEYAYRACISWLSLAAAWQHDVSSTGQTFPAGSWATTTTRASNPGTSYHYSGSATASVQVVTDDDQAGMTAALFFLTDRVGGSFTASTLSFTLDGEATYPVGYDADNPFATDSINPSGTSSNGITVARFALPDDGDAHTIVATATTGGMTYWGWGVEALHPIAVCNVARIMDAGYSGTASDDDVADVNAVIDAVVTEFGTPVTVIDIDSVLDKDQANFADNTHPNDTGHADIAAEILAWLEALRLSDQRARFL